MQCNAMNCCKYTHIHIFSAAAEEPQMGDAGDDMGDEMAEEPNYQAYSLPPQPKVEGTLITQFNDTLFFLFKFYAFFFRCFLVLSVNLNTVQNTRHTRKLKKYYQK